MNGATGTAGIMGAPSSGNPFELEKAREISSNEVGCAGRFFQALESSVSSRFAPPAPRPNDGSTSCTYGPNTTVFRKVGAGGAAEVDAAKCC